MKTRYVPQLTPDVGPEDHVRGNPNAPVTLVEYGDFQCPYCGAAYPIVKEVERLAGPMLRVVFRNFPLRTIHLHAEGAAEAAEAAAARGMFWEMHDTLFEHQRRLTPGDLEQYAEGIGLEMTRFRKEMGEGTWRGKVHDEFRGGMMSGVNGTPTFFINGMRHDGDYSVEAILAAVKEASERGRVRCKR
jgi:protein-disulfide isomerase